MAEHDSKPWFPAKRYGWGWGPLTQGENTTLHLAEALAQVPYSVSHPCVVQRDGVPHTVMIAGTDHCCRNFQLADH